MSDCPTDQQLQAVLQQTLVGSEQSFVESHLGECESCQGRMDHLTDADDLVAKAADLSSIPKSIAARLRNPSGTHDRSTSPSHQAATAEEPMPAAIGDFEIHEHIASGASGALYRATDRILGRPVALKVMHSTMATSRSARERARREARALASISHPNVVSAYSFGEDDRQRPFLAMEFVDGCTLSELIQDTIFLEPLRAAELIQQGALGLAAIHEHGLIHRDIKSTNMLLDSSGTARIVDLGLVRSEEHETQLTQEGFLAGTPAYMSPEQIVDPATVDGRTDVYSLGIVLYEMLTGVVPFRGVLRMTLQQVQHSEPQPPQELNDAIPVDLQNICLKAIEKDVDRRYPSASDLAADLQRFRNGEPVKARPIGRLVKSARWCRRNPRNAILSGLVGFAVLTTVGVTATAAWRLKIANTEVRESNQQARQNLTALTVQRNAAMETVRQLVFDLPPLLDTFEEDTSDVQAKVLQIALAGLDKVAQSAEDSGEVDYNTAHALQQLGLALYLNDDLKEAELQLNRGLSLTEQMQKSGEPINVTAPLAIDVRSSLAAIYWDREDAKTERIHCQAAVDLAKRWNAQQPENDQSCLALGSSLNRLADCAFSGGDSEKAQQLFKESLVLLTSLSSDEYTTAEIEFAETGLADCLNEAPDPEVYQLKRQRQMTVRTQRNIVEEATDNRGAKRLLYFALLDLAEWHSFLGSSQNAESLCQEAVDLLDESSPTFVYDKAVADRYLAEALINEDYAWGRCRRILRRSVAAFESLDSDKHAKLPQELIHTRLLLADTQLVQDTDAAQATFQRAMEELAVSPNLKRHTLLDYDIQIGLAWVAWQNDSQSTMKQLDEVESKLLRLESEESSGIKLQEVMMRRDRFDNLQEQVLEME